MATTNILNVRQLTEVSETPPIEFRLPLISNVILQRLETETPIVQKLSNGRGEGPNQTLSNIDIIFNLRRIGSVIDTYLNPLRARAQFFENEEETKNILAALENCVHN